jgi:hypothetical protein
VVVEAAGQTVVVEKNISQTGDVSAGADLPSIPISSMILISFSRSPTAKHGNKKKNPINKNGINASTELTEDRSEELGGIQYHVWGLSSSCRSTLREAVLVALKAVVHGGDDGRVKDMEGTLVLVGSAKAMGTSRADRRSTARRMAILVAPVCFSGMFAVVVSTASFATGSERLMGTFSGRIRPASRWQVVVDEGSSMTAETGVVTVENEVLPSSFCGISEYDAAPPPTRMNQHIRSAIATIQNPGIANLAPAPD